MPSSGIVGSVLPEDARAFRRATRMATVTETPATTSSRRSADYWIFLTVAIVASIVIRLLINTKFEAPTILTDELTYSQLARDIADGNLSLGNGYGIVYPLLLAPSWLFNTYGTDAYTWMKATNAVLVSLTAIPVFLWARRMMQPRYALRAALLTLLMPSMAYSGHVMTENAFLLFFMLAVWAMAVAVERPTLLNQLLVVVAIVAAFATRAQAVVLLAALPLIILLYVLAEERATGAFSIAGCARRVLRFWPLAAIAGLGVLAIAVRTLATNWKVSQLLQAYSATTGGQYTVENVSRYFLWHLGEATFALGIIPVAALLLLVGLGILNRTRSSAERAYLATAIVAMPLVILQVAIFTSWFSQRVSERNMFCVFPIVLIGLALWLDIRARRPPRTTALAAAVAGVLVLSVPFGFLYQRAPSTETWAIVLPELLTRKLSRGADDVQILIVVGVAIALLVFGMLRPRLLLLGAPLIVAGYFMISQVAVVHTIGKVAADYRNAPGLGPDADWLERAVPKGTGVAFISGSSLGPDTERLIGWELSFFNRTPLQWLTWGTDLTADPLTGRVTSPAGEPITLPVDVITPSSLQFDGPVIRDRGAFLLQQPLRPYSLARASAGIYADGWTSESATITVYEASPPSEDLRIAVSRAFPDLVPPAAIVTVEIGRLSRLADGSVGMAISATRILRISGTEEAVDTLPRPAVPFQIRVTVTPGFTPSEAGMADTRVLGARLSIRDGTTELAR